MGFMVVLEAGTAVVSLLGLTGGTAGMPLIGLRPSATEAAAPEVVADGE